MGRLSHFAVTNYSAGSGCLASLADILLNPAGFQAGGTDGQAFGLAVDYDADPLKVRHKPPLGYVMGMGNIVAEERPFPADFTYFRHR
jgi:hypothetical protein